MTLLDRIAELERRRRMMQDAAALVDSGWPEAGIEATVHAIVYGMEWAAFISARDGIHVALREVDPDPLHRRV